VIFGRLGEQRFQPVVNDYLILVRRKLEPGFLCNRGLKRFN
jgi:hypothetical protein